MDKDRVEGAATNIKGKVKEGVGKMTGDEGGSGNRHIAMNDEALLLGGGVRKGAHSPKLGLRFLRRKHRYLI